jgi:hypothetical protein
LRALDAAAAKGDIEPGAAFPAASLFAPRGCFVLGDGCESEADEMAFDSATAEIDELYSDVAQFQQRRAQRVATLSPVYRVLFLRGRVEAASRLGDHCFGEFLQNIRNVCDTRSEFDFNVVFRTAFRILFRRARPSTGVAQLLSLGSWESFVASWNAVQLLPLKLDEKEARLDEARNKLARTEEELAKMRQAMAPEDANTEDVNTSLASEVAECEQWRLDAVRGVDTSQHALDAAKKRIPALALHGDKGHRGDKAEGSIAGVIERLLQENGNGGDVAEGVYVGERGDPGVGQPSAEVYPRLRMC